MTGILLGLCKKKNIPGVCILAETFGHPAYLGVRGSRALVVALDKALVYRPALGGRVEKVIVRVHAGKHALVWDGLDRTGNSLPAGDYTWKLLQTTGQ